MRAPVQELARRGILSATHSLLDEKKLSSASTTGLIVYAVLNAAHPNFTKPFPRAFDSKHVMQAIFLRSNAQCSGPGCSQPGRSGFGALQRSGTASRGLCALLRHQLSERLLLSGL